MSADVLERPTLLPDLSDAEETERDRRAPGDRLQQRYNTFDQVISILQKATGCSREEAEMETWEIDAAGEVDRPSRRAERVRARGGDHRHDRDPRRRRAGVTGNAEFL